MPLDPSDGADPVTNGQSADSVHEPLAEQTTVPPDAAGPSHAAPPTVAEAAGQQPADYRTGAPPIPGYEVLRELGRGGMGVVYMARHLRLNRLVALKVILAGGHAGGEELARFRTEAEAVARLQHPNVVQIFDVGEHEGRPYMALEYVAGGSLSARVGDAPLPAAEAAALVRTLAAAVQAAHDARVVHRDLKPANVLLAEDGTPKVTDFGLAKKLDESGHTATGAVMGTPSYMAPEQAGGKAKEVGPAADVWALGAVLYKLLTGRPPFQAATAMDTLVQVLADDPVPVRRLNPAVPRDLETVCLRCLEKDADQRYAAAQELADELGRHLAGEPVAARPVGAAERAWKWARRRPVVAGLLALVVLVGVAGAGGVLWQYGLAVSERDRALNAVTAARAAEAAARQAEGEARAEKDRTRYMLYLSQIGRADAQLSALDVVAARQSLDAAPRDCRGWEFRYLSRRVEGTPLILRSHAGPVLTAAFSPDGARVATASLDGTARVWDARSGGEALVLGGDTDGAIAAAFSPDAARLATGSADGTVRLRDARAGAKSLVLRGHTDRVSAMAFSPDGTRLATAAQDKTARVWDARTGAEILVLRGHSKWLSTVAFSPDGARLATGSEDGTARVWDARTGAECLVVRDGPDQVTAVAFSPDRARLATGAGDGSVRCRDARTGAVFFTFRCPTGLVTAVAFSPDGARLATGSEDGTARVWAARTGAEPLALRGHTEMVTMLAFSPDGARLATASWDGTARVWDARTGAEPLIFRGTQGPVAFSPDGARVATASDDHTARLWDARTGAELLALRGHTDRVSAMAFSPDGTRLATAAQDKTARVWDARTGAEILVLRGHSKWLSAVAFSPDGARLATAGGGVGLWDARTGAELLALPGHTEGVTALAFSPDGARLATAGGGVGLWDARTGAEALAPRGTQGPVAFSPDGTRLATDCSDGIVRLWDVRTGAEALALRGYSRRVAGVAFSPDGARLATGSWDGTVRLWDARTGVEALALHGHTGAVFNVAFSPDGARLATGSGDGTLRLWDARRDGYDPWAEDEYRRRALAVTWHTEDAEIAEKGGDSFAAAFHLGRLLRLRPLDAALHSRRAASLDKLGRAEEAAFHRAAAWIINCFPLLTSGK